MYLNLVKHHQFLFGERFLRTTEAIKFLKELGQQRSERLTAFRRDDGLLVNNKGPNSFDEVVGVDKALHSTQAASRTIPRVLFLLLFAYLVGNELLLQGQFKCGVQLATISGHLVNSLLSSFFSRVTS